LFYLKSQLLKLAFFLSNFSSSHLFFFFFILLLFSAYIVFCGAKRAEVKAANPDATFGELGKILGKMWGKLDEKQKVNSIYIFCTILQPTISLTVQNLIFL